MNKNVIVYTIAIFAMMVSFFSCVPQPLPISGGGSAVIRFIPTLDGEEIEFNTDEEYIFNGEKIKFVDFKFYLSNLFLEDENGDLIDLIPLKLVEFEGSIPPTFNMQNIPLGNYEGIRFDVGVPPSDNASFWDPNRFGGSHPLNNELMYDQRLSSYKFLVLDGNIGEDTDLKTFNYGPGGNDLFQDNKLINLQVSLTTEQIASIDIEVDMGIILEDIDVLNNLRSTPNNNAELGGDLMKNLRRSFRDK